MTATACTLKVRCCSIIFRLVLLYIYLTRLHCTARSPNIWRLELYVLIEIGQILYHLYSPGLETTIFNFLHLVRLLLKAKPGNRDDEYIEMLLSSCLQTDMQLFRVFTILTFPLLIQSHSIKIPNSPIDYLYHNNVNLAVERLFLSFPQAEI